jgi:hypothetical protein
LKNKERKTPVTKLTQNDVDLLAFVLDTIKQAKVAPIENITQLLATAESQLDYFIKRGQE